MHNNKSLHVVIFLTALALLLAACQPPANETIDPTEEIMVTEEPVETETPEELETTEPDEVPDPSGPEVDQTLAGPIVLDPAVTQNSEALFLAEMIYEGLVTYGDSGEIVDALATTWSISDDALDYVVELRPNVQFHDGIVLTADIVLDNFNRWFDPKHPLHGDSANYQTWLDYFGGFLGDLDEDEKPKSPYDGIEKVDDLTVLIHLNQPLPEFMKYMADPAFSIINTEALTQNPETYGTAEGPAIGTGPYQLASWTDDVITLTPFGSYWGEIPADTLMFGIE